MAKVSRQPMLVVTIGDREAWFEIRDETPTQAQPGLCAELTGLPSVDSEPPPSAPSLIASFSRPAHVPPDSQPEFKDV